MTTNNAAELLIRIAADPSGAEESIRQFRAGFGSDLSGITADLARWSAGGSNEFGRIQAAALGFSGRLRGDFISLNQLLNTNRQSSALWRAAFVSDVQAVQNSSLALQATLVGGFLLFDSALARNTANALIWQQSIGAAFQKAAVTAISAIAQEAIVRAIFSTALGFYLLAIRDFSGAARAFQSAAIFGAVGGAAALAGRALAGGESTGSASVQVRGRASTAAASARQATDALRASQSAVQSQPTIQVIFQGPVFGGQAGIDELTRKISEAVVERDVNLVAFTTVRQPVRRA